MTAVLQSSTALVPVTATRAFDPSQARTDFEVGFGLRVSDIVALVFPRATDGLLSRVRVHLVSDQGTAIIPQHQWQLVTPHAGVHVVIRLVPAEDGIRSLLQVFVTIAATFLAPYLAPVFAAFGLTAQAALGLATLAITTAGMLLVNALIPPPRAEEKDTPTFATTGFKNALKAGGIVPAVVGRHRIAPPYAAYPYAEIVGDLQYQRCLFCVGYGPVKISDIKIGDTDIADFDEIEVEIREGYPADGKVSLYPQQVIEEQYNVDLRYEQPRDDLGNYIAGSTPAEAPVLRVSVGDAASVNVVILFPGGLVNIQKGKKRWHSVNVRIRTRPLGSAVWQTDETIRLSNISTEAFFRVHPVSFAVRGRHEVEVTRLTQNTKSITISDRTVLASIQSVRPEYPLALDRPMALIAVRIKATYQLNGALDNLNCLASRVAPDYDVATGQWIARETRNPASLARWILNTLSVKPIPLAEIDDAWFAEFHAFCRTNNLHYDMILSGERSMFEQLIACMAAGRASPRWDGVKWGGVIDRPQELVVDHINDRNARAIQWQRSFVQPPHAFRVPFFDASNEFQTAERLVPWPGHAGDITIVEELELPGKTDPAEVWIETRRRQYEAIHRAERFTAVQDGALRVVTRGDRVMASFSALSRTMFVARVQSVSGNAIEIDQNIALKEDQSYAMRFRVGISDNKPLGESVVVPIMYASDELSRLLLVEGNIFPQPGDIIHIGPATLDSVPAVVSAIEAGDEMSSVITMVPVSDEIDRLTSLEVPPAWDARVGDTYLVVGVAPPVPVIVGVLTGIAGTGDRNTAVINVRPGNGIGAPVAKYTFKYRKQGEAVWLNETVLASAGGITLGGFVFGDIIEMQISALASDATPSAFGPLVVFTIGADDGALPGALTVSQGNFSATLGTISAVYTTGAQTAQMTIYRQTGRGGVLDKGADFVRTDPVLASASGQFVVGDLTVNNLARNGTLSTDAEWTKGTGWSIGAGVASHASGTAGDLDQLLNAPLSSGAIYVISGDVDGRTAGTLTPQLTGTAKAASAISADGPFAQTITADAAHTGYGFSATATFDGNIDNVAIYAQTAACLAPGWHTIWLEPRNVDDVAGPLAGPFEIFVR